MVNYRLIMGGSVLPFAVLASRISNPAILATLGWATVAAVIAYLVSMRLIPHFEPFLHRRGLRGKDLGRLGQKNADEEIPSALGVVVGVVCVIALIVLQVFYAKTPHDLAQFNAAILCICFMIFLGFVDDVVDLPWRYKLVLPTAASLPLLCSYTGVTTLVMPVFARPLLWADGAPTLLSRLLDLVFSVDPHSAGSIVDIGPFYYLYMAMLGVFCTNAINIYAGINGLEVGQSIVVALAVLATNLYELSGVAPGAAPAAAASASQWHPHMLSATVMLCFIAVSLALLRSNWFPARVFVGDTYCYFAGMSFAVAGILGHFSKTLLLYLLPQIINFIYSCPQLFKLVPCPRHRLPAVDRATGLRTPSTFEHRGRSYDNLTVINWVLRRVGPVREETLTVILLALQAACCVAGFVVRHYLGPVWLYEGK
jgi:UDP-N-acetylglucosamine--dolichyl-phosphate N-acetylglucosaminephosphotransferase